MLELKKISKTYKTGNYNQNALKNINLFFEKNEFVSILGPSGSGKTTLLNIIGGLDKYDSGDLIINGKSTKNFKDSDYDAYRNNSIGFIFQSYNLITHISVLKNVEMCLTLSGKGRKERKELATKALEKVGLKNHINKKPNQLSGGQMQRVAIARALVNDPDIILADEPTGALDSKTSKEVMDLIKEISKEKLVIMVTHNPELAKQYSNRIIELKDGEVVSDSKQEKEVKNEENKYFFKKTSMSFLTALNLSLTNIFTKKGRTILTAFASSIGIIGISLILALSNGFDMYIDDFESDTMASFPIIVSEQSMNLDEEQMQTLSEESMNMWNGKTTDKDKIIPYNTLDNEMIHENEITDDYVNYIEKIDSENINGISYTRITNLNILSKNDEVKLLNNNDFNMVSLPKELKEENKSYLERGYDLLEGNYPKDENEVVITVDNENRLEKSIIDALGIDSSKKELDYKEFIGKELKIVLNDEMYKNLGEFFTINTDLETLYNNENNITIKIVGVVRAKEDNMIGIMMSSMMGSTKTGSILYDNNLMEKVIEKNSNSEIAKKQNETEYNLLTGEKFNNEGENTKDNTLKYLGALSTPVSISIYPKDFNKKEDIINYLDKYNEDKGEEEAILYTDLAETFSNLSANIMDAITIVLVAFSSISLVVSSIMIGIITYISVLERTKEIGILRSLGARKKDITRVFNAETFIIGSLSGILGIIIARILIFPTNSLLYNLTELENIAQMSILHVIILIGVSVALTLIGGFIPAKIASRKDPVESLRSE